MLYLYIYEIQAIYDIKATFEFLTFALIQLSNKLSETICNF